MGMVRTCSSLRQRQTLSCHDPERVLDLARRSCRDRFEVAALAGGDAEINLGSFYTDWQ